MYIYIILMWRKSQQCQTAEKIFLKNRKKVLDKHCYPCYYGTVNRDNDKNTTGHRPERKTT